MNKTAGKHLVLPYIDQDQDFWKKVRDLCGEQISEVYFPIIDDEIPSGRPRQPEKHLKEFLESGILPVSVLINPIILNRPVDYYTDRVLRKLEYYSLNYRLTGVTLTNLTLGKRIREAFPNLKLAASTLMEITGEQQLRMIMDTFDIIVPPSRVIRDIRLLRSLRKSFHGTIRLMVNEACLASCIFRNQHFYEMSDRGITHPGSLCNEVLELNPWMRLTGGWILPQHLFLFRGLYDEIKLSGRVTLQRPADFFRVLNGYLNDRELMPNEIGGGPASVNIPMPIGTAFYKHTLYCKKNCTSCNVCSDYWTFNAGRHV